MAVQVGKVTTTPNGRYHYIANGRAKCGSGSGRILATAVRNVTDADGIGICRRCRNDIHAAIKAAARPALQLVEPAPTARPGHVLVRVGRGYVERPIRPLSAFGRIAAGHRAAMAA